MTRQKNSALSAGTDWAQNPDNWASAGNTRFYSNSSPKFFQPHFGKHSRLIRRMVKTLIFTLANQNLIPVKWADYLIGGLKHD